MKSIILNIRANYDEMGRGERKIADLILFDPHCVLPLTITQFSELAGCGTATLVRFSKRLGINGYQGLKLAIAQEITNCLNKVQLKLIWLNNLYLPMFYA